MKKPILIILTLLVFNVFPHNVNLIAKTQLPIDFPESSAYNPDHSMTIDKTKPLELIKGININMSNIDSYAMFESDELILKTGSFRINNTQFEINIFNYDNSMDLIEWAQKEFPPYALNEDNFSNEFTKNEKNESKNYLIMTNKVESGYFVSYFKKYSNFVFALGFQLGKYAVKDLPYVLRSIQFEESMDFSGLNLETSLLSKTSEVKQFNLIKNLKDTSLNVTNNKVYADSIYYLPWTATQSYMVTQDWGTNDTPPCTGPTQCTSHYGINGYAYDFGLPENTDVLASASGTVAYIKGGETICGAYARVSNANYVVINHDDGKATNYYHLKSVNVTAGQQVSRGELIGKSGKTGYTGTADNTDCAAHLHFQKQPQGGAYTQSEAFYFAEYPNVDQGEVVYGSYPVSQNVLSLGGCNGTNPTMTNWNVSSNLNCTPTGSLTIQPTSTLTAPSSGAIIIQPNY